MAKLSQTLLFAALSGVCFAGACSSDDTTIPPIDYEIDVAKLDGTALPLLCKVVPDVGAGGDGSRQPACVENADDDGNLEIDLRCDGTLAVEVKTFPESPNDFLLRPANACGESVRCGYVHIEGLAEDGSLLASVDTATTQGVLTLSAEQLPQLAQIRVALIRGLDQKPLLKQDLTPVEGVRHPRFVAPTDCSAPIGAGGAGGAGPNPDAGGAGPNAGGQGGQPLGGAGGQAPQGGQGGAGTPDALGGAGGTPDLPGSGDSGASGGGAGGAAP